jgi:hypothetical protein
MYDFYVISEFILMGHELVKICILVTKNLYYIILPITVFIVSLKWFYIFQGNRPDFHCAMSADKSKEFYEKFLQMLRDAYEPDKIKGKI